MTSLNQLVITIFGDRNYGVTKIKDTEFESVYACECKTMLRKDKNYLFVIGTKDIISIGSNVRIEDVNTTCIQFRTFQEPILQKVLSNKIDLENILSSIPIKRYNISKDENGNKISEYLFEHNGKPYNAHLFHTTDSDFEYVPDGNLYSAIITWNTMIIPSVDVVSKQAPQTQLQTRQELSDPYQFHKQPRTEIRQTRLQNQPRLQPRQSPPPQQQFRPQPPQQRSSLQSRPPLLHVPPPRLPLQLQLPSRPPPPSYQQQLPPRPHPRYSQYQQNVYKS